MVALTRSMSAATSLTSGSIEASWGFSKGTITATPVSTFAILTMTIETAAPRGKGRNAAEIYLIFRGDREFAGIGSNQRYRAGVGDRRAARRRQYRAFRGGSEHEHHRGLARHPAAAHFGA